MNMSIIMTMLMVNIADAKARLSEYLDAVAQGEQVIICNRNRPVAELRAIAPARTAPRDLSPMFPDWKIDPKFFEPLTDEELAAWEGLDTDIPGATQGAEARPSYPARRKPRRKRS
jgi:prevent-host-death family protein